MTLKANKTILNCTTNANGDKYWQHRSFKAPSGQFWTHDPWPHDLDLAKNRSSQWGVSCSCKMPFKQLASTHVNHLLCSKVLFWQIQGLSYWNKSVWKKIDSEKCFLRWFEFWCLFSFVSQKEEVYFWLVPTSILCHEQKRVHDQS